MRIRMTKTSKGATNGHTVKEYPVGTEHEMGASPGARSLAAVFLQQGWAEEVGAKSAPSPTRPPQLRRLPPLEEYVAAGYLAENYEAFLARHRAEAEAAGEQVVVEALPPEILTEARAATPEPVAPAPAPEPVPAPAPVSTPAPAPEPDRRHSKKHKGR